MPTGIVPPPCHPGPGARPSRKDVVVGESRRRWFPGSHADPCYCRQGRNCCCASAAHLRGLSAAHPCALVARIGGRCLGSIVACSTTGVDGCGARGPVSFSIAF